MINFLIAYAAATVFFLVIDALWLGFIAKDFFQDKLGFLLLDEFKLHIAGLFYLSYTVGVVVFAVLPAMANENWLQALGYGALFGFLAYGTYDFTNLATIKNWPPIVTLVDVTWGTTITALSAVVGYFALKQFGSF